MVHYLSYRSVLKARFGRPVLKLPLNGGFSCPNRDGTKSAEGCFFCDNRSFSPAAKLGAVPPLEQLKERIAKLRDPDKLLLPYLQPFSNTYGTVEMLQSVYEPLLTVPGVIGLAIGTRPDCFSEEIHAYLADLSKRTWLTVELGLQSAHDVTLRSCNRGHTFDEFSTAVEVLSAAGIETVAHVMLGLPGETPQMMRQTAQAIAALPCTGVKIHQLMIVDGTEYALQYQRGTVTILTVEVYAELVMEFLAYLRPNQHIHRIMADATVANGLIAPLWSADKMGTLQKLHAIMDHQGFRQGQALNRTAPR